MRWPFKDWGADVIMSGHDHLYERLNVNGLPAFIVGTGGAGLHELGSPLHPNSQFRTDSQPARAARRDQHAARLPLLQPQRHAARQPDPQRYRQTAAATSPPPPPPRAARPPYIPTRLDLEISRQRHQPGHRLAGARVQRRHLEDRRRPARLRRRRRSDRRRLRPEPSNKYITTYFRKTLQRRQRVAGHGAEPAAHARRRRGRLPQRHRGLSAATCRPARSPTPRCASTADRRATRSTRRRISPRCWSPART